MPNTNLMNIHQVNGKSLYIEVEGQGTPVIFIHGFGGTTNAFQPQSTHLLRTGGYKIIRFDIYGHGRSPLQSQSSGDAPIIDDFAEDVGGVLRAAGVDEGDAVHVVGHSFGGLIAMVFAASHPERVKSLTLIGPVGAPLPEAGREGLGKRCEAVKEKGMAAIADTVVTAATSSETKSSAGGAVVYGFVREMLARQDPGGYAAALMALVNTTSLPDLTHISAPVLVVIGTEDAVSKPELGKSIAAKFEKAKVEVVEVKAGHWHGLEQPGQVNEALEGFLGAK